MLAGAGTFELEVRNERLHAALTASSARLAASLVSQVTRLATPSPWCIWGLGNLPCPFFPLFLCILCPVEQRHANRLTQMSC